MLRKTWGSSFTHWLPVIAPRIAPFRSSPPRALLQTSTSAQSSGANVRTTTSGSQMTSILGSRFTYGEWFRGFVPAHLIRLFHISQFSSSSWSPSQLIWPDWPYLFSKKSFQGKDGISVTTLPLEGWKPVSAGLNFASPTWRGRKN